MEKVSPWKTMTDTEGRAVTFNAGRIESLQEDTYMSGAMDEPPKKQASVSMTFASGMTFQLPGTIESNLALLGIRSDDLRTPPKELTDAK